MKKLHIHLSKRRVCLISLPAEGKLMDTANCVLSANISPLLLVPVSHRMCLEDPEGSITKAGTDLCPPGLGSRGADRETPPAFSGPTQWKERGKELQKGECIVGKTLSTCFGFSRFKIFH